MIECRQLIDEAMVEIRTEAKDLELYGARVSWSAGGSEFRPCAIYRGRGTDDLLECTFWEWNEAVEHGNVKWDGRPNAVCWNLYLDDMHRHRGPVTIRLEAVGLDRVHLWEQQVELVPSKALFLNDWQACIGDQVGWKVDGEHGLTVEPGAEVSPLRVPLPVTGRYDLYLGIRYGNVTARLKMSDDAYHDAPFGYTNRAEFQDKAHKEIPWKTVELRDGSALEISLSPGTLRAPGLYPFGAIRYLKLVPVKPPARKRSNWDDKALALYTEPYGLDTRAKVKEVLEQLRDFGAREIHVHICRFGAKTMHYSRIAERYDSGALMADDGTFIPEETAAVRALDLLETSIDICRELGVTHYANAGLTCCYPGTDSEERISREHPEWRTGNILRFNRPETRAHAAGIIGEFVEWGTDAVSIDCMRYPYYHTEEDLLALFAEMHQAIVAQAKGRVVPLTARIPAGDVTYFRAFERLAREGIVQCVIPSTLLQREPWFSLKPYLKWQDYGCRVYGIIDGWLTHIGSHDNYQLSLGRNPRDIREDIGRFFNEGADGLFVYGTYSDVFCRPALDWSSWSAPTQCETEAHI